MRRLCRYVLSNAAGKKKLYDMQGSDDYLAMAEGLAADPADPGSKSWMHVRIPARNPRRPPSTFNVSDRATAHRALHRTVNRLRQPVSATQMAATQACVPRAKRLMLSEPTISCLSRNNRH